MARINSVSAGRVQIDLQLAQLSRCILLAVHGACRSVVLGGGFGAHALVVGLAITESERLVPVASQAHSIEILTDT